MTVVKEGYQPIALPKRVIEEIKRIVESENSLYTNVTDFAKQAIREKIEKINGQKT